MHLSNLHTNTLFPPHQMLPEIREFAAKASRKLRYLNQALPSHTATLGSGRWIKSHVFNVGPLMKACDSFIKWQGPPRKLAKEVFVEFIPAKEKNSFAKEWQKVLAKDHVIRRESHEVFNTAQSRAVETSSDPFIKRACRVLILGPCSRISWLD